MSNEPWKGWIPGVLSKKQLKILVKSNCITNVRYPNKACKESSIDLYLTDQGYIMNKGSVKPSGNKYIEEVLDKKLAKSLPTEKGGIKLKPKTTYLFKLRENISGLKKSGIYGQATAKSTIGRVDVLARLIVDGMDCYEGFDPDGLKKSSGEMYIEITPMTFWVKVKKDIPLSQLRLFYGDPKNVEIKGKELYETVFNCENQDGSLSVDLSKTKIGESDEEACAFCTIENDSVEPIKLWEEEEEKKPDPKDYWEPKSPDELDRLKIEKNAFYIMRSKERISMPEGVAVYCRATDETIGEMRIHYAGFVHPYFGKKRKDKKIGTPLIFEIRGHDVDVSLRNGEKMAILTFYRMSKDDTQQDNAYTNQELQLSKIFKEWI